MWCLCCICCGIGGGFVIVIITDVIGIISVMCVGFVVVANVRVGVCVMASVIINVIGLRIGIVNVFMCIAIIVTGC